jgi:16S rRNA (uracil1498-N3)-methyltransferase
VAPGARVSFPDHVAHHAREVLRLRAGSHVHLFDGRGNEYAAVLEAVTRREVTAHVESPALAKPESPLHLVLAVSPLKGDRMELVIQKATELGVAEIWPVVSARTDTAARPALQGSRQQRWEKVASGAAEQSGRAVVPRLAPTLTLGGLLEASLPERRILFLETAGHPPLAPGDPAPDAVLALVGPVGGFEDHEVGRLQTAGFQACSLGPRVLRSETAAVAAVTLLQFLWGDLG